MQTYKGFDHWFVKQDFRWQCHLSIPGGNPELMRFVGHATKAAAQRSAKGFVDDILEGGDKI